MSLQIPKTSASNTNEKKSLTGYSGVKFVSYRTYIRYGLIALICWGIAAAILAAWYTHRQVTQEYGDVAEGLENAANIAQLGLDRHIGLLQSFPDTIGKDELVVRTLRLANAEAATGQHQEMATLDRRLKREVKNLQAMSILWVIDAQGRTVSASNAGNWDSFVGTNYSDRDYFKDAMKGKFGQQFAVGRVTNAPGLFFSAPVRDGSKVIGVVAGKVNLNYLTQWISNPQGYLADENGVIVAAYDKTLEMHALPNASALKMPHDYLEARYKKTSFEQIQFRVSDLPDLPFARKITGVPGYSYMTTKPLENSKLVVTLTAPIPRADTIQRDWGYALFVFATSGWLLIFVIENVIYISRDRANKRKHTEDIELIKYMAEHDGLTSLYNINALEMLVASAVKASLASGKEGAVLFLDLDEFKRVNDFMGREVGDEVMRQVASRLQSVLRSTDEVARYTGDDFVIVLSPFEEGSSIDAVCQKIMAAIEAPFVIGNDRISLTACIGVAVLPRDGKDHSTLIRNADIALCKAKNRAKATYCFYTRQMGEEIDEIRNLEVEMETALARGDFKLHYQPQFSNLTGGIIGFEALIRWTHPRLGSVSPAKFIPIAERTGLISRIGIWSIYEACAQAALWKRQLGKDITVAVNVSPTQFFDGTLIPTVRDALAINGLYGNSLEVEITERLMMSDVNEAKRIIAELKEMDVKVSLDDFGTGHSCLAYLKDFDIGAIKIDQSFVKEIDNKSTAAIIEMIISIGNSLGAHVIAEGVESKEQFLKLRGMGCHSIQGYLLSKPVPAEETMTILREHSNELDAKGSSRLAA